MNRQGANSAPYGGRCIADILTINRLEYHHRPTVEELWRIRTLLVRQGVSTADADALVRWLPRMEESQRGRYDLT